jgi:SAM-dependent methyltransferase
MARAFALEHCRNTPSGDCCWYHGVWQYFRVLGIIKNAGGQGDFIGGQLRSLAMNGAAARVLISGSADDAIARIVIDAFRQTGQTLNLTAVDQCESPLALSRWSAARAGVGLASHCGDILEFTADAPFDVIVANGFLSYFEPTNFPRLFARWAALLRPGGKLLLTNRLRPNASPAPTVFDEVEKGQFCDRVREAARLHQQTLAIAPEVLAGWAREYADRLRAFPLRSVDELMNLLAGASFIPDLVDTVQFDGSPRAASLTGPTSAGRATYVRVLATRR